MSMKCPYFGNDMTLGYIQGQGTLYWAKKQRAVPALPPLGCSYIKLSSDEGGLYENAVEAYRCPECKKLIIDYSDESRFYQMKD